MDHVDVDLDASHGHCLVFVGENGSGKTLLLSSIADSLIEMRRTATPNIPDVHEGKLFKISSNNYVAKGNSFSQVRIEYQHQGNKFVYSDFNFLNDDPDFSQIEGGAPSGRVILSEGKLRRSISGDISESLISQFLVVDFPSGRFFEPFWLNRTQYFQGTEYGCPSFAGSFSDKIVANDILAELYPWIVDVFLEKILVNDIDKNGFFQYRQTRIQSCLSALLNLIIPGAKFSSLPTRFRKTIGVHTDKCDISDISQLSNGELNLFCLGASLLEKWEHLAGSSQDFFFKSVSGVAIIDEIELGLNINHIFNTLPQLIDLFPNIQFVLSTNSPFVLDSLSSKLREEATFINLPSGTNLTNVMDFSQFDQAVAIFQKDTGRAIAEAATLKKQIESIKEQKDRVILLVEGESDQILLEHAMSVLGLSLPLLVLSCNGFANIEDIMNIFIKHKEFPDKLIGLFDRDVCCGTKKASILSRLAEEEFHQFSDNVFALALPVPEWRKNDDSFVSIEHLFKDEITLAHIGKQRLFFAKEFNDYSGLLITDPNVLCRSAIKTSGITIISSSGNKVTDQNGNGEYALSKTEFAHAIERGTIATGISDYSAFGLLFDSIKKILSKLCERP